jgi:hypothetical protein
MTIYTSLSGEESKTTMAAPGSYGFGNYGRTPM